MVVAVSSPDLSVDAVMTPYDLADSLTTLPPKPTDDVPLTDEEKRALEVMMRKVAEKSFGKKRS